MSSPVGSPTSRTAQAPEGLKKAVDKAEEALGPEMRLLHYLSVPPTAAPDVIQMLESLRPLGALAGDHGEAFRDRSCQRPQAQ